MGNWDGYDLLPISTESVMLNSDTIVTGLQDIPDAILTDEEIMQKLENELSKEEQKRRMYTRAKIPLRDALCEELYAKGIIWNRSKNANDYTMN